jgi:hypothetical protein
MIELVSGFIVGQFRKASFAFEFRPRTQMDQLLPIKWEEKLSSECPQNAGQY